MVLIIDGEKVMDFFETYKFEVQRAENLLEGRTGIPNTKSGTRFTSTASIYILI